MEKFTSKQERLMEKARDLKNKVLKKVTALQIFKGTKKSGKQIIKDSDKVVIFKMENGQEFITNGYFMIKKGYDKAMDEMLVKFADKVEVMEQKMKTFYTGYESDYAMVTNADVRVFNTLLTTEKTTMITKNDSMDTYHAYMNSYYYRYFEKKVSKMGISSTVQPVVMFDDKNEFVGCILPVRMTLEGKKEFENTLTFEEFNEGEKLIKEYRETLLVEIIEGNTDECLEQAVADTERRKKEFDGFIASELKVIKNIDGYYEVGYELEGINELYTHISVYGTRDYGHYDYFLNKPDTKRLAERMLEKIQKELEKNTIEKVENDMERKQFKKADVTKSMIELGKFLKESKRTEEEIRNKIWDIFPKADEIFYRKEDESVSFIAGVDYVGAKPTKNTMLEIDENFARVESMDGLMYNIYQEEDKIKMSADVMVTYVDKWGMDYEYDVVIKEYEVEIPRYKEMKKHIKDITDTVEEFGWTVMNILVNIKEENCVGAVIENKYGKLKLEGLYAGDDKGDESIELAKKLANYYDVEIIDANGMDIHDLEEEKILEQLSELVSPEMLVAIADKLGLPSIEEEVSPEPTAEDVAEWQGLENKKEKEEEVKEVKDIKIINKTDNEVLEKLLKEVIEKTKEFEFNEEITICDYDLDRVYLDNKKSDDLTIRMWNITQFTKENKEVVLSIEWTLFENIDNHGEEVSCGFTRIEMPPEQEKEIGCKLDMYIELYNSYNEEIEELDMELAIDGLSEQRVRCLKSIRKILEDRINNAQSKITSLGEVYVVKYTQRTMSIPSQVRVFKKLEDAEKFADTNENTLEVEGIYIAKNGKLIELDEEKLTPEIKEITKRLDDIAKDIEKNDGYYDYNLENGCTLRLFTDESNPIGITLEIFDSSGMFYMRKVGDENIHEYIDKVEKAQDVLVYEKYGLDDYIDSETGNVAIDVKDIKNKGNIFGTPLEEVIDKLLKENKEFEMKLFNENYIKEPHYMIFRKGEIKNE